MGGMSWQACSSGSPPESSSPSPPRLKSSVWFHIPKSESLVQGPWHAPITDQQPLWIGLKPWRNDNCQIISLPRSLRP